MGTFARIILHVKAKDIGNTIRFDKKKFPSKITLEKEEYLENGLTPESEAIIIPKEEYAAGYVNFDGHIESVGKVLFNNFKTYEEVLNLLCLSPWSYLEEDKALSYYLWYTGSEERRKQCLQPERVKVYFDSDDKALSEGFYYYKFEEGKWWVFAPYIGITNWTELTEELIKEHEEK